MLQHLDFNCQLEINFNIKIAIVILFTHAFGPISRAYENN